MTDTMVDSAGKLLLQLSGHRVAQYLYHMEKPARIRWAKDTFAGRGFSLKWPDGKPGYVDCWRSGGVRIEYGAEWQSFTWANIDKRFMNMREERQV